MSAHTGGTRQRTNECKPRYDAGGNVRNDASHRSRAARRFLPRERPLTSLCPPLGRTARKTTSRLSTGDWPSVRDKATVQDMYSQQAGQPTGDSRPK